MKVGGGGTTKKAKRSQAERHTNRERNLEKKRKTHREKGRRDTRTGEGARGGRLPGDRGEVEQNERGRRPCYAMTGSNMSSGVPGAKKYCPRLSKHLL